MNLRALKQSQFFLREYWKHTDKQTEAHITSNGMNRYSAYRIDMQAYYIATLFAALCIFGEFPKTAGELAVKSIGFQMAVEVARHFNTAIRWTFKMELDLVAVKRLLKYAELQPEERNTLDPDTKLRGKIEFKDVEMRYQAHL